MTLLGAVGQNWRRRIGWGRLNLPYELYATASDAISR